MSIFIASDTAVYLPNVRDSITDEVLPSVSVSGKVLDSDGDVLDPAITFTLLPISGSPGDYSGKIAATDTAGLTEGTEYIVELIAVNSGTTIVARPHEKAIYKE